MELDFINEQNSELNRKLSPKIYFTDTSRKWKIVGYSNRKEGFGSVRIDQTVDVSNPTENGSNLSSKYLYNDCTWTKE